jgi:hypothetical protein
MSDGNVLSGQQYDKQNGIIRQFTEQRMDRTNADAVLAQAATEIIPGQYDDALVRVFSSTSAAYLAVTPRLIAGYHNMLADQVPDMLTGVTVTFNFSEQEGSDTNDEPLVFVTGNSGTYNSDATSQAQAGASVMPSIQPEIKQTPQRVKCTNAFFYMVGDFTESDILTKLSGVTYFNASVSAWPIFRPVAHTVVLKGQQVSLRANCRAKQYLTFSGDGATLSSYAFELIPGNDPDNDYTQGVITGKLNEGNATEVGLSNQIVTIPPTIHALITFSSNTLSKTASVTVSAKIRAATVTGLLSGTLNAINNSPGTQTATAEANIYPTSLPATNVTAIPTSGLYLVDLQSSFVESGVSFVHATVINASQFA